MISRKSTFFLGIFIFLIPFLGIPTSYKTFFVAFGGLLLILLSLQINIPTPPKKVTKPRTRKEKAPTTSSEISPKEVFISDIKPKGDNSEIR